MLKATKVVYAWDRVSDSYENGNVAIEWWNGTWVPFFHQLDFDAFDWVRDPDNPLDPPYPTGCAAGQTTPWAGLMEYGLANEKNGAPGFQHSSNWELVACDRDGDGDFIDQADQSYAPPPYYSYHRTTFDICEPEVTGGTYCVLLQQDDPRPCGNQACDMEIVTTFFINLDLDCDGAVDPEVVQSGLWGPTGGLCFYAEGQVPFGPPTIEWGGNVQARISAGGGDKTVNFNLVPTAIELASFTAAPQGNGVLLSWETATEFDNLGFHLYRARTPDGQRTQLDQRLIPSQSPGNAVGASYTFLDETATPGNTYYYWLEDVDVYGVAVQHGPAVAEVPLARVLPGRPRPVPRPNAF
jgi:hypothetical protein